MSEAPALSKSRSALPLWLPTVATVIVALLLWRSFCTIQQVQWNAPRLTPAFAIMAGVNFYGLRDVGPYLGWIYGPVFPLYLSPVALLPDLAAAYAAAWLLNLAAFVVPVGLFAREVFPPGPARRWTLLLALVLAWSGEASLSGFHFLHVDLLCAGLTLLGVVFLLRHLRRPESRLTLALAGLAIALAIWTKQSAIATPLVLILWLRAEKQGPMAARFVGWTLLFALLLGAIFIVWFGGGRLWFNLVEVVARDRFRSDWPAFLSKLALSASGPCAAALVALLLRRKIAAPILGPAGRALVWLILGSLPLGALAAAKAAGGWNSLHSITYALVLLALVLARAFTEVQWPRLELLATAALGIPLVFGWITADTVELRWTPSASQVRDLASARERPGRIYLPWNPLVTLITDRKIYPFDDALLCLERVGLEPPRASVQRELPHGALVVYPDPVQSQFALRYFGLPASPAHP